MPPSSSTWSAGTRVTHCRWVPDHVLPAAQAARAVREAADISSLEVIINAPASRAWCQRAPRRRSDTTGDRAADAPGACPLKVLDICSLT